MVPLAGRGLGSGCRRRGIPARPLACAPRSSGQTNPACTPDSEVRCAQRTSLAPMRGLSGHQLASRLGPGNNRTQASVWTCISSTSRAWSTMFCIARSRHNTGGNFADVRVGRLRGLGHRLGCAALPPHRGSRALKSGGAACCQRSSGRKTCQGVEATASAHCACSARPCGAAGGSVRGPRCCAPRAPLWRKNSGAFLRLVDDHAQHLSLHTSASRRCASRPTCESPGPQLEPTPAACQWAAPGEGSGRTPRPDFSGTMLRGRRSDASAAWAVPPVTTNGYPSYESARVAAAPRCVVS